MYDIDASYPKKRSADPSVGPRFEMYGFKRLFNNKCEAGVDGFLN